MLKNTVYLHVPLRQKKGFEKHKKNFVEYIEIFQRENVGSTFKTKWSGVQVSCTETQFRKCSYSGKNSSKHSMYLYLWLTMWFQATEIQRNTQKNQNRRIYYVNAAPRLRNDQKLSKKRITQSQFAQIVFIGMAYIGCYLVNPHVQTFHNMFGKGG